MHIYLRALHRCAIMFGLILFLESIWSVGVLPELRCFFVCLLVITWLSEVEVYGHQNIPRFRNQCVFSDDMPIGPLNQLGQEVCLQVY